MTGLLLPAATYATRWSMWILVPSMYGFCTRQPYPTTVPTTHTQVGVVGRFGFEDGRTGRGYQSASAAAAATPVNQCNKKDGDDDPLTRTQRAFDVLANQNKSWLRFGPVVELAILASPRTASTRHNTSSSHHHHHKHQVQSQQQQQQEEQLRPSILPLTAPAEVAAEPASVGAGAGSSLSPICGSSVVDVGTDHGLLAIGLAASGHFREVLGTDISESSLQSGALTLLKQVNDYRRHRRNRQQPPDDVDSNMDTAHGNHLGLAPLPPLPVEFCVADGLRCPGLQKGQADIVCLAGMGVHTMLTILTQRTTTTTTTTTVQPPSRLSPPSQLHPPQHQNEDFLVDRLECQSIVVQPTNSRPKNLITLYDQLQQMGWTPTEERISYVAERFHMSTLFQRRRVVAAVAVDNEMAVEEPSRPTTQAASTTTITPPSRATPSVLARAEAQSLILLPGELLANRVVGANLEQSRQEQQLERDVWDQYVGHHSAWIRKDRAVAGRFVAEELRWLQRFGKEGQRGGRSY